MSGGDWTKRNEILWGITPAEALPWLEYKKPEQLVREAIVMLFDAFTEKDPTSSYCDTCRELGDDDCASCDKNIEVLNGDD